MKMSCSGCRVLRKGCTDNCVIRPCLEWINSPESQANATLFLAKFYGRTALLNLIAAAPHHLRPAVFRSLLYEACGRLVNPTHGSIGLFWTGEWARCEAAVNAVLSGSPINGVANFYWQATGWSLGGDHVPPAYDIRHVPRVTDVGGMGERTRLKRPRKVIKPKPQVGSVDWTALWKPSWDRGNLESMDASLVSQEEPDRAAETGLSLELSLGFGCQSTSGRKKHY